MRNLLRAELTRFTARKIVWIGLGVAFLGLVGLMVLTTFQTDAPSAAERTQAEAAYARNHQDWVDNHVQYEQDCRDSNPPAGTDCSYPEPQLKDFLLQLGFAEVAPSVTMAGVGFFGLAALLIAASLIGADFSTGSMANWLSFVPVRARVYASKLLVAVVGPTLVAAVLIAPVVLALGLIITAQQGAAAVTGWSTVWATYGRGVAVIAFGAVLGGTVGFLTRRTIAAVGIILGYFVLQQITSGIFQFASWYQKIVPWLPENNALALLMADYTYQVPKQTVTADGISVDYTEAVLHWQDALAYLSVTGVVLVVVALLVFRRRDVT